MNTGITGDLAPDGAIGGSVIGDAHVFTLTAGVRGEQLRSELLNVSARVTIRAHRWSVGPRDDAPTNNARQR